jgi:chromosomal replication initiation ATPase DnaA
MQTLAQWVSLPENRSALAAVERVADCLCSRPEGGKPPARLAFKPLFLHGPDGVGKSQLVAGLVAGLVARLAERAPRLSAVVLTAGDFDRNPAESNAELAAAVPRAASCPCHDLVAVEDVHALSAAAVEAVVGLVDRGLARQVQLVFTAVAGPAQLELPARLTGRLGGGLVVGLQPLAAASRFTFICDRAVRKGLAVDAAVCRRLADHIGGSGRELAGAVTRLHGGPPDRETVAKAFRTDAEARRHWSSRVAYAPGSPN